MFTPASHAGPSRLLTPNKTFATLKSHLVRSRRPTPCQVCLKSRSLSNHSSTRHYASSSTTTQTPTPLRLAIIGAGPSGFYTASRVLSSLPADSPNGKDVEVHMYERLPTPYGLVRYGVAPDHPEVKNCQHKFDELAKDPRFKYFGNVLITSQPSIPSNDPPGSNADSQSKPLSALSTYTYPHAITLPLSSLVNHYNSLLLSYGASLSNPLSSVQGSSSSPQPLINVIPALALVGWYNGHPAFADLPINLQGISDVSIIGQGNVALDVSRILLKSVASLEKTDIPDDILDVLSKSDVKNVRAVGRRGPGQVAFTTKEFREIRDIKKVGYRGIKGGMMEDAKSLIGGDRMRNRILGLMEKDNQWVNNSQEGGESSEKSFILDFLRSPHSFIGSNGKVTSVEWAINQLLPSAPNYPEPPNGQSTKNGDEIGKGLKAGSTVDVIARPTGETVTTKADMVIESVGYRSEPLGPVSTGDSWGLPFDTTRGRVKNVGGRVISEDGVAVRGIYAAGWVARGPIGVIASTMHDAYSVADQLLSDHYSTLTPSNGSISMDDTSPLARSPGKGLPSEIERGWKEGKVVDLEKWGQIDQAERERGKKSGKGKEREKFRRVEEMLAVLS